MTTQRPAMQWILASLSLSALLASLGTSIANVGLPTLAQKFDAPFQQVQWVVLAYLLTVTASIVSVGRLGDVLGRRRLVLVGIGVFTLAALACGVAPSLGWLIAARALQGLGAAIMMALTMAFVGDVVPREQTGSAMGLLGTMSAVGTALGPVLGGALIAAFGWRAMFFAQVPLGVLAFVLALRWLPSDGVATARPRFDVAGTVLLAATLSAYALAMTLGRGDFGMRNAALLIAAASGAALFVFVQLRAVSPLVRLALFRDPVVRAGFASSALVTTVVMATLVVGPFYLSRALSLDAAHVGLAMSAGPIVAALVGVPAGRGVDRFGAGRMAAVGLVAMFVGAIGFGVMPGGFGPWSYIAPLVVLTAGYALFQAANNTGVMQGVDAQHRGVLSGLLNLSRNLGLVTGASVMGAVFASAPSVVAGMHATFLVAAFLIACALAILATSRSSARRPVIA